MAKILVVYHSLGGNTKAAAEAVAKGASSVENTEVMLKESLHAAETDLLACDGIAIGTPDYFSYMAGGLKDFFDRTFYPTQGQVSDKPCVIFVTHGGGGKAVDSVEKIARSFKFNPIAESLLIRNKPDEEATGKLEALGKSLAEACSA